MIKMMKDLDGHLTYMGLFDYSQKIKSENTYDITERKHDIITYTFKELEYIISVKRSSEFVPSFSKEIEEISINVYANDIMVAHKTGLLDKRIIKIFGKRKHDLLYTDIFNKGIIQKSKILKNGYVDFKFGTYGVNTLYYRVRLEDVLFLKTKKLPQNFVTLFNKDLKNAREYLIK